MKIKAVRVWAHKLCPENSDIGKMFRSMGLCTDIVKLLCDYFKGKSLYVGDGSEVCQISDLVYFNEIDDDDFKFILHIFKEFVTDATGLYDKLIMNKN